MAQFKSFSTNVEVRSELVLAILDVMGAFRTIAVEILLEHGIEDPQPGLWYSQQAWLDTLAAISKRVGPNTLYQMARQIPTGAMIPPEIDTIEKAFANLDDEYKMAHRGGEIGHYSYVRSGDRSAKIVCRNPYPCDFDRGIIEALARRFEPDNVLLDIRHDDPMHCKKMGAEACTFTVNW